MHVLLVLARSNPIFICHGATRLTIDDEPGLGNPRRITRTKNFSPLSGRQELSTTNPDETGSRTAGGRRRRSDAIGRDGHRQDLIAGRRSDSKGWRCGHRLASASLPLVILGIVSRVWVAPAVLESKVKFASFRHFFFSFSPTEYSLGSDAVRSAATRLHIS